MSSSSVRAVSIITMLCTPAGAQPPAERVPVLAREHHVQDEQIEVAPAQQRVGLVSVGGGGHVVPLVHEVVPEADPQVGVVLDDEDGGAGGEEGSGSSSMRLGKGQREGGALGAGGGDAELAPVDMP